MAQFAALSICVLAVPAALASGAVGPFERGLIDLDNEHYDAARYNFTEAIRQKPHDAYSYAMRSRCFMDEGRLKESLADANRAIELDPKLAYPYSYRGYYYMSVKRYEDGIKDCTSAIDLNQLDFYQLNLAVDHNNRAHAYKLLGRRDLAVADAPNIAALELVDKAVKAREKGQLHEAMEKLDRAITANPRQVTCWFMRGVLESNMRSYWRAASDFTHTIDLQPLSPVGYYFRADAYEQLAEHQKAIDDYSKILQLKPRIVAFRYVCETGRLREHFEGKDVEVVDIADIYYLRAQSETAQGQLKEAIEDLSEVIKLDPTDRSAFAQRADLIASIGKSTTAIADYSKAVSVSPKNWQSYKNRAEAYERIGDYRNAIVDYGSIIQLNPKDAGAYLLRARLYDKENMPKEAIDDYTTIIFLTANDDDAYRCRGSCYMKIKQYEKALSDFNQAIKLDPRNSAFAYEARASAYRALGKTELAEKDQEAADRINGKKIVPASQAFPWKKLSLLAVPAGALLGVLIAAAVAFLALRRRKGKSAAPK